MFTAECDQCGARNKLPASAEDEGINSGSLVPCSSCGAEVCVRLSSELPEADRDAIAEQMARMAQVAQMTSIEVPDDDSGDDELTRVMEPNLLPDADAEHRVNAAADPIVEELDPPTARRAHIATEKDADVPLVDLSELEATPESLVPLSSRDFLEEPSAKKEEPSAEKEEPSPKLERHLPMPPVRAVHAESNESSEVSDEIPVSFGTPTLAALVRKVTPPHAPQRVHLETDEEPKAHDVLVPPAGPIDELWDARVIPLLRPPSATEAPVASVSRPPEPRKEQPKSNGVLGFALLVAGVAFVAGLAVKNARETDSATPPALPAAAPLKEAPAVAPLPMPAVEAQNQPAPPNPEAPQSETAAEASPPPLLAAPENEPGKPAKVPSPAPKTEPALAKPEPAPATPKSVSEPPRSRTEDTPRAARTEEAPRSTVAPVRSATVATDAPPPEAAFDSTATANALNAAAQRASSCKKPTDPSGVAVVTITFSPSGRVTSANISGPPFAGTETGSCIASVLRGVRVPAYSGDFMTVKKTIQVE